MNKKTSNEVSHLAAQILRREPATRTDTASLAYNSLLDDAKILAGSCLSQDETPGQEPKTFLDLGGAIKPPETFRERLEMEREELRQRFNRLGAFIQGGCPGVTDDEQIDLLKTQHAIMEQYLRVLTLRTGKLAPVGAVASAKEVGIGEAVETGGHDEDRDGPIPFAG